jgi:hypothetical protein
MGLFLLFVLRFSGPGRSHPNPLSLFVGREASGDGGWSMSPLMCGDSECAADLAAMIDSQQRLEDSNCNSKDWIEFGKNRVKFWIA